MKSIEHYLSLNYRTSLYRDDEGDFVIEVPDLAGCAADGRTPNEAFENLHSAMRSWIESRIAAGLEVPEPRSADDYSGRFLVRMPKYLHERLSRQAEVEDVSLNQYVVSLLSEASMASKSREVATGVSANLENWWSNARWCPQGTFAIPTSGTYFTLNNDSMLTEPLQGLLTNRTGLTRLTVSQESRKDPVLRPQLVPKQPAA